MSEEATPERATPPEAGAENLPPYRIERARSSRSSCKTCRRPIQKDKLRLGVRVEGPFGPGFLWHHLSCAARKRPDDLQQAYAGKFHEAGIELPTLEELLAEVEIQEKKKAEKPVPPFAERAPTGRSKCKQCGELIEEGALRLVLLRKVEFGNQVRSGPIFVHPRCGAAALAAPDDATPRADFAAQVRANSQNLSAAEVDSALVELGPVAEQP